jgi:hypothetical protein
MIKVSNRNRRLASPLPTLADVGFVAVEIRLRHARHAVHLFRQPSLNRPRNFRNWISTGAAHGSGVITHLVKEPPCITIPQEKPGSRCARCSPPDSPPPR